MNENSTTKASDDDLKEMQSQTDWKALQSKTDAEIQQGIDADPDAHALDEDWFQVAQSVVPSSDKKRITIRLDEDIIVYFKREGDGYQSRINDVLKTFVIAKRVQEERASRSS